MDQPQNASNLQEIIIFYILFYMCRRGRENLRPMQKGTFAVATDPEVNKRYIYQAIDEADKNHKRHGTKIANQGKVYEITG